MLMKLLRTHLAPYKRTLWLIVGLQIVAVAAALSLPTVNAKIIDNGVLKSNQHYIYTWGGVMLLLSLVQVTFAVGGVYFGAKVTMGAGRDLRSNLYHRVTDYSARE